MANYEDPYVVRKVFSRGALILATMDGEDHPSHVNWMQSKYTTLETIWKKSKFDKLKTRKSNLGKNGYPSRLKTRKGGLGKN